MKKFSWTKTASSRRTLRNRRILYTFCIGLALLFLWWLLPRVLSVTASVFLKPIIVTETWFAESGSALPSYFRDRNNLLQEKENLEQELAEEKLNNEAIHKLELENNELRGLLGTGDSNRVVAGIIGRPSLLPYDVLVIDRGKESGVVVNSPVYLGQHRIIGFVAEVYDDSAVVVLVTTPGLESTAYIYGPNIYTTAEGVGGGTLRVSVPQGIVLEEGNPVILPALDAGLYGSITTVDSVPTRPEQYGYVTMDFPLQSIHFVSISTEPLVPISFDEAKTIVANGRRDFLEVPVPEDLIVDVLDDVATTTASSSDPI